MGKCEDCILYDDCMSKPCDDFKQKPKDKPMENKFIFENDGQFRMTLLQMIPFEFVSIIPEQFIHKCREKAQEYNIIRKSAVEEAEEAISLYRHETSIEFDRKYTVSNFIQLLIKSFIELKAENERLKG